MSASPEPAAGEVQRSAGLTGSDLALYTIVVIAWGSSWIALKWQAGVVAPEVSVLWRILLSCPLMFAWAWHARHRLAFPVSQHLLFAAMGATMFSLNYVLFYKASLAIASGLLAVVFSLASLYNLALGALFFGQRIEPRLALAGVSGVAGLCLMFAPEIIEQDFDVAAAVALGQCLFATLLFCLGNMASAASQRKGQSVLSASAWGMLYGTLILFVLVLLAGETLQVEWTARYLGSLVMLAI